jgi:hypothetical protein
MSQGDASKSHLSGKALSKEMKDQQNLEKAAAAVSSSPVENATVSANLTDGDAAGTDATQDDKFSSSKQSFAHGVERGDVSGVSDQRQGKTTSHEHIRPPCPHISPAQIPVYVVHKKTDTQSDTSRAQREDRDGNKMSTASEVTETGCLEEAKSDATVPTSKMDSPAKADSFERMPQTNSAGDGSLLAQVPTPLFHFRNSLLENLPHLLSVMEKKGKKAAVVSGLVFGKHPITPSQLAAQHEMMFLAENDGTNCSDLASSLAVAVEMVVGEHSRVGVEVSSGRALFTVGPSSNQVSTVEGNDAVCIQANIVLYNERPVVVGQVFSFSSGQEKLHDIDRKTKGPSQSERDAVLEEEAAMEVADAEREQEGKKNKNTAATSHASEASSHVGAVLYLDTIAQHALRLPDLRLLWSEDRRFLGQFTVDHSPDNMASRLSAFTSFHPFSLYPVRFIHDVSFWENPGRVFEETEFLDAIREVADDVVTSVVLVDRLDLLLTK